jgi:type IV secretion system protein VirD4
VNVSEQRRPLMLPQEVQAMRSDEAIVFYEGIRPVRCKKIRYVSDWRFKRLIGPPPPHASPALASGEAAPFAASASPQIVILLTV